MLCDPQLCNMSYTHNDEDLIIEGEILLEKGVTYITTIDRIDVGIYRSGLNFQHNVKNLLNQFPIMPDSEMDCFGVCDNYEQVLHLYPRTIADPQRKFVLDVSEIRKVDQPPKGGWRWHKWGEYIGRQKRCGYEYLYDEPNIDIVYVYRWIELGDEK